MARRARAFQYREVITAKLGLLPLPFFPPPQAIVEVVVDDLGAARWRVADHLLATGYFLGAAVGFVTGVAIGWSQLTGMESPSCASSGRCLRADGFTPSAIFVFPSSFRQHFPDCARHRLFPVTVLTGQASPA